MGFVIFVKKNLMYNVIKKLNKAITKTETVPFDLCPCSRFSMKGHLDPVSFTTNCSKN